MVWAESGWNPPEERRSKISSFWSQHIEGLLDPYFLHLGLFPSASSLSVSFPMVRSIRRSKPLRNATSLVGSLLQKLNPNFRYTKYNITISFTTPGL